MTLRHEKIQHLPDKKQQQQQQTVKSEKAESRVILISKSFTFKQHWHILKESDIFVMHYYTDCISGL